MQDAAKTIMGDMYLMEPGTKCRTHIGKWNFHYNSWKNFNKNKILFIKYEDLIKNKEAILKKIILFLSNLTKSNIQEDKNKIQNVIKTTSFDELKKNESKNGFFEASTDKKTNKKKIFFNLGPKNNWRELLDKETVDQVNTLFQKEMLQLGYL